MSILHCVTASPHQSSALSDCLTLTTSTDIVLLLQDGVMAALNQGPWQVMLKTSNCRVVVLEEDLQARGLQGFVHADFQVINMNDFVTLTEEYPTQITW